MDNSSDSQVVYPQQMGYPPQAVEPPAKSKKWVVIVVAAVVILMIIGIVLNARSDESSSGSSGSSGSSSSSDTNAAKLEADRLAAQQLSQQLAAAKLEAERLAAQQQAATAKLEAERLAAQQLARQVKTIEIVKDLTVFSTLSTYKPDDNNYTFQIGELRLYDLNGNIIPRDAYAYAVYNTPATHGYAIRFPASNAYDGDINTFVHTTLGSLIHKLTVVLKVSHPVSKIEVYQRQDCCQARLIGAVLSAFNENGDVIKRQVLTGASKDDVNTITL